MDAGVIRAIDRAACEVVTCPICAQNASYAFSAGDYHYGNEGVFRLYSCGTCRHLFQYPIPDEEVLRGYYPKTYYAHGSVVTKLEPHGMRGRGLRLLEHYCRRCRGYEHLSVSGNPFLALLAYLRLVRKRLNLSVPVYVHGGSICDFGSGSGHYVATLRHLGWQAEGVELSRDAVLAARNGGLNVTQGSYEVLEGRLEAFDLIRSSHSVEHVPDVRRLFRAFFAALRPGGKLAIEVPNGESRATLEFRGRSFYLTMPVHLHLFSPESLRRIAEESGFTAIQLETVSFWKTHAASWLLGRDMRRGSKVLNIERYGYWALAAARIPTLRSFLRSGGGRGDCLLLYCERPLST